MINQDVEKIIDMAIRDYSCGMISGQYMFTSHGLRGVLIQLFKDKVCVPVEPNSGMIRAAKEFTQDSEVRVINVYIAMTQHYKLLGSVE